MRLPRVRPLSLLGLGITAGVLGSAAPGCGLRSDPLFSVETDGPSAMMTDGDTDTDTGDTDTDTGLGDEPKAEGDPGTCSNPIELPTTDTTVSGEIAGGEGLYAGVCHDDIGNGDVYRFTPTAATDVTIIFDPDATTFTPIVRVQENGCVPGEGGQLRACTNDWFDGSTPDRRHFLAFGNREYNIHIDSENGGTYAFDVVLAPAPLDQCDVHPEVVTQQPGSIFRWENDFSPGQGRVDSQCGGVGKENMFAIDMLAPGSLTVNSTGFDGFQPVVSIRNDCSAITEVDCASEFLLGTPGFASVSAFIPAPGRYYVAADSLNLDGGAYALEVIFD